MSITPEQLRKARRTLRWSIIALAIESRVGAVTISRIENGKLKGENRLTKLQAVLEAAGAKFEGAGDIGVTQPERESSAERHRTPPIISAQWRAARGLIGKSRKEIAALVGVTVSTLQRLESGGFAASEKVEKQVRAVFEAAGVEFIAENGGGAGVRLRKSGQ